eukprot:gene29262-35326_t
MAKRQNMKWTPEMDLALVKLVVSKGVHKMNGKSGVLEAWNALTEDLFRQPAFLSMEKSTAGSIKASDVRKIRERIEKLVTEATEFMASGNTSKNDGDLSELHRQINQIITDTEVIEEEKKDATLLKKRVDDTEAMVLKEP